MEVTNSNFEEVYKTLPDVFKEAQFLTFDTEFTGLRLEGDHYNYFDLLTDLYESCRKRASTFLALQFGICAFRHDPANDRYTYKAYNFYVFPSSSRKNFLCQVSCMRFLSDHGFDFNKLFKDGIPYLTDVELEAELAKLKTRQEKQVQAMESPCMRVRPDNKALLESVLARVEDFLSSDDSQRSLPRYNSFVRRLIYQKTYEKFGDLVHLETNKDETMLMSKKLSDEEKKKRLEEKWEAERQEVYQQVGFSKVIKLIIDSGKPLVGHNLIIDLLFTINQFLQPLPSYKEFREMAHDLFPRLFDTKHLVSVSDLKLVNESSLPGILESLDKSQIPEATSTPEFGYPSGIEHPHEAAYDAYQTGLAFLALTGRIGALNMTNIYKTLPSSPLLDPYVNKLSVPRMHDIPCMDLGGIEAVPDRKTVFHITFPEVWKKDDIFNHFKDYGFINISWIDTTSAYIGVGKDVVQKLKKAMLPKNNSVCKVQPYYSYRKLRESSVEERKETTNTTGRKRVSSDDLEAISPTAAKKCAFDVPSFD